ncbi:MAG: MerR family transcriptional regulator [Acidobacteriota bacterium]
MRLTVKEFAALHGVHRSTVQLWIDRGWIKAKRVEGGPLAYWTIDSRQPRPEKRPGPAKAVQSEQSKKHK